MNPIPMRRHRQQLSQQQSINLLESSTSGTLSLNQPDGFPYQVPLSYVYTDGKLYFHCAQSGNWICSTRTTAPDFVSSHRTGFVPSTTPPFIRAWCCAAGCASWSSPMKRWMPCVNCVHAMSRWTARRATSRPSTRSGPRCVSSALKSNR